MEEPQEQPQVQSSGGRIVIHHTRPAWTREERAGFAFIIGAGFLALVLGFFYMLHHVSSPFYVDYTGPHFQTDAQKQAALLAEQKAKDTDGDTLSDYDEIYIYKTSPYITDTDGDTLSDASEVQSGTSPTCPTGADCATVLANPDGVSGSAVKDSIGEAPTQPTASTTGGAGQTSADVQAALSSMSVAQIRQLLVQAGASQAQVDALSDTEVMSLYQSVLTDVQSQQSASGASATATP